MLTEPPLGVRVPTLLHADTEHSHVYAPWVVLALAVLLPRSASTRILAVNAGFRAACHPMRRPWGCYEGAWRALNLADAYRMTTGSVST